MNRAAWGVAALVLALALGAGLAAHATARLAGGGEPFPWAGMRGLAAERGLDVRTIAADPAVLSGVDAARAVLVLPPGGRPYDPSELAQVQGFAARGGRVVVLANPGAAAAFGFGLGGARVRVPGGDAVPVTMADLTATLAEVRPVLLAPPGAATVAWTANATFLDADGDGAATPQDVAGPFPFARGSADGGVLVLGSAGLVTPEGLAAADTRALARSLLDAALAPGVVVVLDDSRAAGPLDAVVRSPAAVALQLPAQPWLAAPLAALLLAGGWLLGPLHPRPVPPVERSLEARVGLEGPR